MKSLLDCPLHLLHPPPVLAQHLACLEWLVALLHEAKPLQGIGNVLECAVQVDGQFHHAEGFGSSRVFGEVFDGIEVFAC